MLQGNHKKAIKLLQNLKVEGEQKWLELSLPTLTSNALGCVHLTMGKPETALYHLKLAIDSHGEAVRSEAFRQRHDMLHQVHRNRLVYNTAVCLLHRGQHAAAFSALKALSASPAMAASPHLWLRMAECCIADNVQDGDGFDQVTDPSSVVVTRNSAVKQLGERETRKLILQQQQQQQQQHGQQPKQQGKSSAFGNGSDTDSGGKLSLLQASSCLKKAAYLLTDILLETKPNPIELRVSSSVFALRLGLYR